MLNRVLIKGGRVVDPASGIDKVKDILIEDGLIVKEFNAKSVVLTVDAKDHLVLPGLIDMHVHLREPGREDEETVMSGARAAAAGGFTTIACMPNTEPPIDSGALVHYIQGRAELSPIDVKVIGAITRGQKGKELAEMGEMSQAGAVAFSDDGRAVSDSYVMRSAMAYSTMFDLPIISHAEDILLAGDGVMHEGRVSTMLGLKGIPALAEEVMAARDIMLAELTGARLHIAHVSTAGTVELIKRAKEAGIKVTGEVTPHHLTLTDDELAQYDTNFKVNPPLRTNSDVAALWQGLTDGVIDVIATDHAPHARHEKELEFETAPFGMIGLETAISLLLTEMGRYKLSLIGLISKMTQNPAKVLGLKAGEISIGRAADITIINHKAKVEVDVNRFESKSRNSPFSGRQLTGRVAYVFKAGKQIVAGGRLCE